MTNPTNRPWNLESFLDSLIYELDKAQDTLSVKGLNRKLTYTVKDVTLDLQTFPEFDGDTVRFVTAKPGETGSSKLTFQLGSIRDHQIREVTRRPPKQGEITIDDIDIPEPERKELRKLGIQSTEDLKRTVEEKKVDITKATDNKINYGDLASLLNKARRQQMPPSVSKAQMSQAQGHTVLTLQGDNLAVAQSLDSFPVAVINNQAVKIIAANDKELKIELQDNQLQPTDNKLQIALDPYAVVTLNLQRSNPPQIPIKKDTP